MSNMNRELSAGVPFSETMKKLFPDAPTLASEETERLKAQARFDALMAKIPLVEEGR